MKHFKRAARHGPLLGTNVVWPGGVQARYGISVTTRWRWERDGKLPKRDINVGGKTGWRPSTLDAFESAAVA